jgi:hypothetical protein
MSLLNVRSYPTALKIKLYFKSVLVRIKVERDHIISLYITTDILCRMFAIERLYKLVIEFLRLKGFLLV